MKETMCWSRRDFVMKSLIGSLAGLPALSYASDLVGDSITTDNELVVLHTNDVHSRIEPFAENDARYAGKGGVIARAKLIESFRNQYKNVLLLDAGDIFQGTTYFSFFKGELEMKAMSLMGYDAATLGNHDFDTGIEGFNKQLVHSNFPMISSNYKFSNTPLDGKIEDHILLKKGPFTIGIFGLGIELKGLVLPVHFGETKYLDPIEMAQEMVSKMRRKCDLLICLSHLGFKYENKKVSDNVIAQKVPGIDLIVGGHTHTFLDQPWVYKHSNGQQCRVVQSGWGGLRLGMLKYTKGVQSAMMLTQSNQLPVV